MSRRNAMNVALTKEEKMSELGFFDFCVDENYGGNIIGFFEEP
jgi:hypothetical protein